jgi:O-acetylserine/cysteine efflux transporter
MGRNRNWTFRFSPSIMPGMRFAHVALAVLVAAVWGLNFVVIEVGLDDFPPLLLSALRYVLAALPLIVLGGPRPAPWRWIVAAGVAIGLVQFSLLFIGMDVGMPAGLASVLMQTQALFTIAFAVPLLHERIDAGQVGGVLLALSGLALLAGGLDGGATVPGFLLVLGAAAGWGAGNICVRAAKPDDPLRFMTWICLVPPLPLLALSLVAEGPGEIGAALSGLDLGGLGAVAYIAFAATTLGWAAWGSLLKRYPAAIVAPFSMLVPIFGLGSAAVLLGEPLTLRRLVATALVVGGVLITLRASRAPRAAKAAGAAVPAPSRA